MFEASMKRRAFVKIALSGLGAVVIAPYLKVGKAFSAEAIKKLALPNEIWKARLTPVQYDILREEGTEPPFTSALLNEHPEGVFACVGCDLQLFPSNYKYDSGTGWPSFFDVIPGHLETKTDYKLRRIYT
jgi:peptide-methionine (R)-S-oxide reductase